MNLDTGLNGRVWVRAYPDYEPLLSFLDGLHPDSERRFWMVLRAMERNISDVQEDSGQIGTGVEILMKLTYNT
jgi:hypothetical protein